LVTAKVLTEALHLLLTGEPGLDQMQMTTAVLG
jgi:hypothetical protein